MSNLCLLPEEGAVHPQCVDCPDILFCDSSAQISSIQGVWATKGQRNKITGMGNTTSQVVRRELSN